VDIGKLGKKLKREAAASPKKAAFLGLAALVAVYFWMPLIWGWISKSNKNMASVTANSSTTPTTSAKPVAAPLLAPSAMQNASVPKAPVARQSWQQTAQWIAEDARMKPAARLSKARDPFVAPIVKHAESKPLEKLTLKPPTISPEAAGLVLTATIVGPQRRVAQISGKTYVVGQVIQPHATKLKDVPSITFQLIEVTQRHAVLEADGQRFVLSLPEPGKTGKIELAGARGRTSP